MAVRADDVALDQFALDERHALVAHDVGTTELDTANMVHIHRLWWVADATVHAGAVLCVLDDGHHPLPHAITVSLPHGPMSIGIPPVVVAVVGLFALLADRLASVLPTGVTVERRKRQFLLADRAALHGRARRVVRIRWHTAQTTSHLEISRRNRSGLMCHRPSLTLKCLVPRTWSKSICSGSKRSPQSAHGARLPRMASAMFAAYRRRRAARFRPLCASAFRSYQAAWYADRQSGQRAFRRPAALSFQPNTSTGSACPHPVQVFIPSMPPLHHPPVTSPGVG